MSHKNPPTSGNEDHFYPQESTMTMDDMEAMYSGNQESGAGENLVTEQRTMSTMNDMNDMGSVPPQDDGTANDHHNMLDASMTDGNGRDDTTTRFETVTTSGKNKLSSSSSSADAATTNAVSSGGGAALSSEFESITDGVALILEKKLDSTKLWAKKLLQAITIYAREMEDAQTEYLRIQRLEHAEAARLDQVEPDVQGAAFSLAQNMTDSAADGVDNRA